MNYRKLYFLFFVLLLLSINYSEAKLTHNGVSQSVVNYCTANFVPYTGANNDINLNVRNVTNIQLIQFANLTNLPACAVATRGIFGYSQGALGVADQLLVCKKNVLDVYVWTPI